MLELIEKFFDIQALLTAQVPMSFVRAVSNRIDWDSKLVAIVGPRGVGKTTILLQHVKKCDDPDTILYLSADSVLLGSASLFELAQTFHLQKGGRVLIVDEVHRYKNWSLEIKTIYDSLPKLRTVISGSSQINILKGKADLARRAAIYNIPGLSFREYLELEHQICLPQTELSNLLRNHREISVDLAKHEKILSYFRNYLSTGYYPYYKEVKEKAGYYKRILNSVDKSIFEDIALNANLQSENLLVFKELLTFLSSIPPGEINIHKISKNIGKKDDTIKNYLQILHDTSLLRFLPNSLAGHAKLRAAEKVYFDNTNLLQAFCYFTGKSAEIGLLRETFAVGQLQNAELIPLYTKKGDLQVQDSVFEIGGKGKGFTQLNDLLNEGYVLSDEIIVGSDRKIPLYLLGLMY